MITSKFAIKVVDAFYEFGYISKSHLDSDALFLNIATTIARTKDLNDTYNAINLGRFCLKNEKKD